jgi:pimeloyl-ACP methyl ester carboxylesterase
MDPVIRALALLILLTAPLLAQDAPGPRQEVEWEIRLKGKRIGHATTLSAMDGAVRVLSSKAQLKITKVPFAYLQELRVAAKDLSLVRYTLRSESVQAKALPTPKGVQLQVTYGKGKEAKQGSREVAAVANTPLVVLDTLVHAHYEVLGSLARRKKAPFEVLVVSPQSTSAVKGHFTPGKAFTVVIDGATRRVREGVLAVGKLNTKLVYDRDLERVYRVEDSQGYTALVVGWPEAYRELDVLCAPELEAVLTIPGGTRAPAPTLVFLPGSGPQDRHGTVGPNAPLRDLARGLAAEGVASLRFDKSGYRLKRDLSSGDRARVKLARTRWFQTTFDSEYLVDARAALAWVRRRPEVSHPFVLGHSLGAVAASEIASLDSSVRGVVLLAGPARPLDVLTLEQSRFQLERRGLGKKVVEARLAPIRELFAGVRKGSVPERANVFGASALYWRDLFARPSLPATLARLKSPVLVLQGKKDCQVSAERDYALLIAALEGRKNPADASRLYPDLNHLFMAVKGQSTGEEYLRLGKLHPALSKHIAEWVKARAAPPKK